MKAVESGHHGALMMADSDYDQKLDELDRLLNDPDSPMEPSKVWSLLAEIASREAAAGAAIKT